MTRMTTFLIFLLFTFLTISLPLAGVYLAGRDIAHVFRFPPLTVPPVPAPFSWPVFWVYFSIFLVTLLIFLTAFFRKPAVVHPASHTVKYRFPWWAWASCLWLMLAWILAWTRIHWFSFLQRHTFILLWLAYIVLANGLCVLRSGHCPMLKRPLFFLALFPTSAFFWWYFEYLNQFVRNWYYTGVDYDPFTYCLHASFSFSTVLPAVYSSQQWLLGIPWIKGRFHPLPPVHQYASKQLSLIVLLIACTGLVAIGQWPEELFSMLWIAPLLILASLLHLSGTKNIFSSLATGDGRPVVSAALAALLCGFFWEMWNYYSLAKWNYSIPYVHRFMIFEMPVLGYLGYLPFGLECMAVVTLLHEATRKKFRQ